jgi:hypothetical protein
MSPQKVLLTAAMKRFECVLVAACFLAAFWGVPDAKINSLKKDEVMSFNDYWGGFAHASVANDSFFNDLHIGALWFPAISNKGYIGYWDISAFYPGGGDQSNLWQAGMWGAGYVEGRANAWRFLGSDGDESDPGKYDTRDEQAIVQTEADFGFPYPYRRLTVHVNSASKPYLVSEGDTVDGDTGLDVKYEWHQWGVPGYDHWVFVHVTVAFTKSIKDFYWGWMSDCDVGDVNLSDVFFDDYAGWDETYKFCYMRDWDYDPLPGDSVWLSPNVIGQVLLAAPPAGGPVTVPPDNAQRWISKNYWDWNNDVSSVQNTYDRLAGIWENPFPPLNPFDYRILNGVGPYQVSAGDTAHFWMAYVIGEGYDEDSHATFHLGTLIEHAKATHTFFDGGMAIPASAIPPQAPDLSPDLPVDIVGDSVRIHWAPYHDIAGGAMADSFIVYRNLINKLGPWERVAAFENSVTETWLKLITGTCAYVWVQAYSAGNKMGSNPWALSSRLYTVDERGILRANNGTITCACINPCEATLLQEYNAEIAALGIEVTWRLAEAGEGMRFFVLRAKMPGAEYEDIPNASISRNGLSFAFKDMDCKPGSIYQYRIDVSDEAGRRQLFETAPIALPALKLTLYQNCPNPFNPSTEIRYYLPGRSWVTVEIYDTCGRRLAQVVNKEQEPGFQTVVWNGFDMRGNSVASGVYFYRLRAGKQTITKKMVVLQ